MATILLLLCHSLVRLVILFGKSQTDLQAFTIHYSTQQRSFVPQDDNGEVALILRYLNVEEF